MSEYRERLLRRRLEAFTVEAEYRRCGRDKAYFYETYCWIPTPDETGLGRSLFKLWDFQEETQACLEQNERVVVCKVRQIGATTQTMMDSFANGFFSDARYELLVVSKSQEDAQTNLAMADHAYQFLPEWMKKRGPKREDASKEIITFKHRSGSLFRSVSIVGTPKRGAGKTADRIVLDEFALIDKPSQVFRALEPAALAAGNIYRTQTRKGMATRGAVFVITSTPRGRKNSFAQLVTAAMDGDASGWVALYHPVTCNRFIAGPADGEAAHRVSLARRLDRDPDPADLDGSERFWAAWRALQSNPLYQSEPWVFFSEYSRTLAEALKESGQSFFAHIPPESDCLPFPYAGAIIEEDGKLSLDLVTADDDYALDALWHFRYLPDEWPRDARIVVAADTSQGVGQDASAAVVLAATTGPEGEDAIDVLAACWTSHMRPNDFAMELRRAGLYFRPEGRSSAHLVVEHPTASATESQVIRTIQLAGYPRHELFRYVAQGRVKERRSEIIGWPTNMKTKPEALNAMAALLPGRIEGDETVPYPLLFGLFPELREELTTYVRTLNPNTGYEKLGADHGCHDDLVMATAIGCAVMARVRNLGAAPRQDAAVSEEAKPLPDGTIVLFDLKKNLEKARRRAERQKQDDEARWHRQLDRAERRKDRTRRREEL